MLEKPKNPNQQETTNKTCTQKTKHAHKTPNPMILCLLEALSSVTKCSLKGQ